MGCPLPSLIPILTLVWAPGGQGTRHLLPLISCFSWEVPLEESNSGEETNLSTGFQSITKAGGGGGLRKREATAKGSRSTFLLPIPCSAQPPGTRAGAALRSLDLLHGLFQPPSEAPQPSSDAHRLWDLRSSFNLSVPQFRPLKWDHSTHLVPSLLHLPMMAFLRPSGPPSPIKARAFPLPSLFLLLLLYTGGPGFVQSSLMMGAMPFSPLIPHPFGPGPLAVLASEKCSINVHSMELKGQRTQSQ